MLVSSACSTGVEQGGPLALGDVYGGEADQGTRPGSETFFGSESVPMDVTVNAGTLENRGDSLVTITAVAVVKPDKMKKLGAVLFPPPKPTKGGGMDFYPGFVRGYPAADRDGRKWGENVPAEGATVEPGESWVLAVGLRATAREAEIERVRVEYTDEDGQRYSILSSQVIKVVPDIDEYQRNG